MIIPGFRWNLPAHSAIYWLLLFYFSCTETSQGCPDARVLNGSGCVCNSYGGITCDNIHRIPDSGSNVYLGIEVQRLGIKHVPPAVFFNTKTQKLALDYNPIGGGLNVNAFGGLEYNLEFLSLGNCSLYHFHRHSLRGRFYVLRVLHLWNNHLSNIAPESFRDTPNLYELSLSGNNLTKLDSSMFAGLSNLRKLDLEGNRIHIIPDQTFKPLRKLQSLHLSGNQLSSVHNNMLLGLGSLRVLMMDRCSVTYIFPAAFSHFPHLAVLNLSHNYIKFLSDNVFKTLHYVSVLRLNHNLLNQAWAKTFKGLSRLEKLDISHNHMKKFAEGIFHNSPKLKQLFLDNNNITSLRKCMLSRKTKLQLLSLIGNPIHCDCKLAWVLDLQERGVTVWGTCAFTRANDVTAITSQYNYRVASCPFVPSECRN